MVCYLYQILMFLLELILLVIIQFLASYLVIKVINLFIQPIHNINIQVYKIFQSQISSNINMNWHSFVLLSTCILLLIQHSISKMQTIELQTQSNLKVTALQALANQAVLQNFADIQYYLTINVGTPGQQEKVLLDTGSGLLWIPSSSCVGCRADGHKFNSNASLTFVDINKNYSIQYMKGQASGFLGQDFIGFQNFKVFAELMVATREADLGGQMFDGIMGLSNDPKYKNIFELGYENEMLASSSFGFKLGVRYLNQKSYFFYNISKQDFPDALFIKTYRSRIWSIPIKGFYVNNKQYYMEQALIDTGTSLTIMPAKQYNQLNIDVFSYFCQPYSKQSMRKCNCNLDLYPNITIISSAVQFNMTPAMYIFGGHYSFYCYLGIDTNPLASFAILGDNFLQHNTVIFDKLNNQIGFIGNYKQLVQYISNDAIILAFQVIAIIMFLAVFVSALILCQAARKQQIQNSSLRKPLAPNPDIYSINYENSLITDSQSQSQGKSNKNRNNNSRTIEIVSKN